MPEGPAAVLPNERVNLLSVLPGFDRLPAEVREEMANAMEEARFAPGELVVREGEIGDRLFVVVSGRAEASVEKQGAQVPVAVFGPGEFFGEIALLAADAKRQATVRALTLLVTLTLDAQKFADLLARDPEARASWERRAADQLVAKFLKVATPFTTLEPQRLRELVASLQPLAVGAGTMIIQQGVIGECCYLLRRGRVEVLLDEAGPAERQIATLSLGAIFGEAALLTTARRSASVRALEPCELLVMKRADLLHALRDDRKAAAEMMQLLHLRDRPRQAAGVKSYPRRNAEGETITILNHPARAAYYQLSAAGWFLWERLDGRHTLRDLTLQYFVAFKALAPLAVAEIVGGLTAAGFAETEALRPDMALEEARKLSWWQRLAFLARRVLEWRVALTELDPWLTRAYRSGIRWFFTRPAHLLWILISLGGLLAFFRAGERAIVALHAMTPAFLLLATILSYLLLIVAHEAGHAFATKSFGRTVPRVGIGWYWFSPIAFVDTSDMWLEDRGPRMAVNLAGIYTNLILAGFSSLGGWFARDPAVVAICYEFSLLSYLVVLFNLNPLLEYDGYYVLMDYLDRPNLRRNALAWIGRELPGALKQPGTLAKHWVELFYGVATLAYIAVMAALVVFFYRWLAHAWVARWFSESVAAAVAWVLALIVVALSAALVWSDLRGEKAGAR